MVKKNKKGKPVQSGASSSSQKPQHNLARQKSHQRHSVQNGEQFIVQKRQKAKDEIDELFASVPKPSEVLARQQKLEAEEKKKKKKRKKMLDKKMSGGSKLDPLAHLGDHRKDRKFIEEDGYRYYVYSEEELKIGQGGGTALCPFDCDCCF